MPLGPVVTNEGEDFQFKASLEQKVKLYLKQCGGVTWRGFYGLSRRSAWYIIV